MHRTQNPKKSNCVKGKLVNYEVIVELKKEVLDAQGRAIRESLQRLGYQDLKDIKVTKRFVLELSSADHDRLAKEIAQEFLANPVSETFVVRRLDSK